MIKKVSNSIYTKDKTHSIVVTKSNKHLTATIVDLEKRKSIYTLKTTTTKGDKKTNPTKTQKATELSAKIADFLKSKKIGSIVFNRNNFLYHGRIKSFADGLRKAGLKF